MNELIQIPEGDADKVPKDYPELFRVWGSEIVQQLRRLNKVPVNFEDIFQAVCLRLIEADCIAKFHAKINDSRPKDIMTEEVATFLGITVDTWTTAQKAYRAGEGLDWMPDPVAGDPTTGDAMWNTLEIVRFKNAGSFEPTEASEATIPEATPGKFKQYLANCVHNAFANWLRTRSRRHKERVIDVLCHVQMGGRDGGPMDHDDLFDIVSPSQAHVRLERDVEIRRTIRKVSLRPAEQDFVGLLAEGYTPTEAADALGLSKVKATEIRQRIATRFARFA